MASSNLINEYVNDKNYYYSMNQPCVYLLTIALSFLSTLAMNSIQEMNLDSIFIRKEHLNLMIIIGLILFGLFLIIHPYFPKPAQKSWLISIISSGFLTIIGFYRVSRTIAGFDILTRDTIHSDDQLSLFAVIYFATCNLLDLILALFYYKDDMDILSGWIHHTFYFLFMVVLIRYHSTFGFSFVFIEEFPTLLLALGHVSSSLRNDLLFGISFIITRVIYHGWFLYVLIVKDYHSAYWKVTMLIMMLHIFWMIKWFQFMIKKAKKSASEIDLKENKSKKKE